MALAANDQVRIDWKIRLSGGVPRQRKSDLAAEAGRLERARDLGAEVVLQRLLQQDRAKAFPSLFDGKAGHAAFLPVKEQPILAVPLLLRPPHVDVSASCREGAMLDCIGRKFMDCQSDV